MRRRFFIPAVAIAILGAGCSSGSEPATVTPGAGGTAGRADAKTVVVYKSPTCGCCEMWSEHMNAAGFNVEIKATNSLDEVRQQVGVPSGQGSCHTAVVGRYFVEGHVPAEDVKRLLAEQPEARGLVVPGMVLGSPGMEQGDIRQPYAVLLVAMDGTTSVYARHNE